MKHFLLFIVAITISLQANANFQDLVQPNELFLAPHQYEKVQAATVDLGGCTGFYISNEGHILSALHCFKGILPHEIRAARSGGTGYKTKKIRHILNGFRGEEVYAPGRQSYIGITKEKSVNDKNFASLDVLFTGARVGLNYLDDIDDHREAEDFIILKQEVKKPVPCLQLRTTKPLAGEIVWSLGYLNWDAIRDGENKLLAPENGKTHLVVSNGRVWPSTVQAIGAFMDVFVPKLEVQFTASEYEPRNAYTATVDSDSGMSGGPIVDYRGRVLGVISRAFKPVYSREKNATSFYHSRLVLDLANEYLREKDLAAINNCR